MKERVIIGDDCIREGADELARRIPVFAQALTMTGPLPLRLRADGFSGLLDVIVSQQISVAAARSVWHRLTLARLIGPREITAASDDALRACGLSGQKIRYARALAASGTDFKRLRELNTREVLAQLVKIPGVGQWTAEIYAMFALGRADVFAPGDLALQEAARMLFVLQTRPNAKSLAEMAQDWAPWRSVAARILWAYYRVAKEREGIK